MQQPAQCINRMLWIIKWFTMHGGPMQNELWGQMSFHDFFLARRSVEKRDVFIIWASMVDVYDAPGNIVDIVLHWNTHCIIRTANRNTDAMMIRLYECFPIHWCISDPFYRNKKVSVQVLWMSLYFIWNIYIML